MRHLFLILGFGVVLGIAVTLIFALDWNRESERESIRLAHATLKTIEAISVHGNDARSSMLEAAIAKNEQAILQNRFVPRQLEVVAKDIVHGDQNGKPAS